MGDAKDDIHVSLYSMPSFLDELLLVTLVCVSRQLWLCCKQYALEINNQY